MKFILASHGAMSTGVLDTVQMLLGPQQEVYAIALRPDEDVARLGERLAAMLDTSDEGNVVFFTDLCFGSPFNQVVALSRTHDIYHITGMNVPTIIEALVCRNCGKSAAEVVDAALIAAENSIKDVRKLLESRKQRDDEEEEW